MPADDIATNLWLRVRSPFRLPKRCHSCRLEDWEVFDVDKAGCLTCGRTHRCQDGGDCPTADDSDHQACEITGCWIRTRNFQQGYTDTGIGLDGEHSLPPIPRPWVEGDHVARWMHQLLYSDTARRCITREMQRIREKASATFARVAKAWKLAKRGPPDVLALLAQTRYAMGGLRMPGKMLGHSEFDELVRVCTLAILEFTSGFKRVLLPHVPPAKVDHFVIGLIYLLRSGIVMFDTVQVVPRVPMLKRLLPMETCLKAYFKIPCKIITEVENITKIALKGLDRRKIRSMLGK